MALAGVQSKTDMCIRLLTTTPLTERNYYTLYVDNPHLGCICALWNRFIFFLFGHMGWFLGDAGDTHNQILIEHEVSLIEQYNQARSDLLSALVQLKSDPTTTAYFETACKTYEASITLRQRQIMEQFGFSHEAFLVGLKIEKSDLLHAAKQDLSALVKQHEQEIDRTQIPAHLLEEVQPTQNDSKFSPVLTVPQIQEPPAKSTPIDDDDDFLPPPLPTTPPVIWDISKLLYTDAPATSLEQLAQAEADLFNVFKAQGGKIQSLQDITLIPQETIQCYANALVKCHFSNAQEIRQSLSLFQKKYRDAHLLLARAFMILMTVVLQTLKAPSFAFEFDLDPLFLMLVHEYLASFVKVFTPELAAKKKFCYSNNPLQSMHTTLKTLYAHTHPGESEEECQQFAKRQLNALLSLLYEEKCKLFEAYFTPEKLKVKESEEQFLPDLYKALQKFKTNATETETADLDRFLKQIIKDDGV